MQTMMLVTLKAQLRRRKKRKKELADFIIVAQLDGRADIFFDVDNKLGKGKGSLYYYPFEATIISEAVFLAKDLVDLFMMIAENEEPNKIPIGMYNEK